MPTKKNKKKNITTKKITSVKKVVVSHIQLNKAERAQFSGNKYPSDKEIALKINTAIEKFTKLKFTSPQKNFGALAQIVSFCFKRIDKAVFTTTDQFHRSLIKLVWKNNLRRAITNSVEENDPQILWKGIYNFILWFNSKK